MIRTRSVAEEAQTECPRKGLGGVETPQGCFGDDGISSRGGTHSRCPFHAQWHPKESGGGKRTRT